MKSLLISLMIAALAVGANGLMAAPRTNHWADEWFKTKYGRSSPAEDARHRAEQAKAAYREELPADAAVFPLSWTEQYLNAKYGRSTPAGEASLKAEQQNTAFRENITGEAAPPLVNWTKQYFRAKWGHEYAGKLGQGRGSNR